MAKSIANLALANTFPDMMLRINEIAHTVSTEVITANGNANGAQTTGNTYLNGILGANVVTVFNTLRGGNVQSNGDLTIGSDLSTAFDIKLGNSSVNVVINSTSITLANSTVEFNIEKPTAAQVSGGDYYLNANGSYTQIVIPEISPIVTNTTGTSAQLVDSFEITTYRCVNYITNVKNNNANGHSMSQLSVLYCNNTSPLYAEFGILESNGSLGSFTANANATHVRVYFAPVPSNTTVQLLRSSIPAG